MKKILSVIALVIIAIVLVTFLSKKDQGANIDAGEEAQVRETVTEFGSRLQDVSLAASEEQVVNAIENAYAEYVTPELLESWKNDPARAPGRLTSSPWPDRIEISSIEKEGDTYTVDGTIILITSVEMTDGGNAGTGAVELTLEERNDEWLISAYEAQAGGNDSAAEGETYTHENPGFSISYPSVLDLHEEEPEGREATFWSELSSPDMPGETFATFHTHGDFSEGTNLSSVRLTLGESSHAEAVANCTTATNGAEASEVEIGGVAFTKLTLTDAGAGNLYETTSYRTVHDGACFAMETVIHSTNIGNYPEGTATEFDREEIENMLDTAVMSFRFTSA